MHMEPMTKREAEHALRAAGFSRSQAVVAVSVVNRVLKEKVAQNHVSGEVLEVRRNGKVAV